MSDHGKFRVRRGNLGAWALRLTVAGDNYEIAWTEDSREAAVFGPELRAFWDAREADCEIVPESPPFVFPPTPWRPYGEFGEPSTATGSWAIPCDSGRHRRAVWAEIIRRVNWHETAVEALRKVANGDVIYQSPARIAMNALAKLGEEKK